MACRSLHSMINKMNSTYTPLTSFMFLPTMLFSILTPPIHSCPSSLALPFFIFVFTLNVIIHYSLVIITIFSIMHSPLWLVHHPHHCFVEVLCGNPTSVYYEVALCDDGGLLVHLHLHLFLTSDKTQWLPTFIIPLFTLYKDRRTITAL